MAAFVITPEIEADALRLAEATGQTPTEAVAEALRAKLKLLPSSRSERKSMEEISELIRSLHGLPVDRSLSEDEILGYSEDSISEQHQLGR